jgi:hypothetical protein
LIAKRKRDNGRKKNSKDKRNARRELRIKLEKKRIGRNARKR